MSQAKDFERAWQTKLRGSLEQATDEATGQQVMLGGEQLSDSSDRRQVIAWSRQAMERLAKKVSPAQHQAILSECACSYPQVQLQSICDAYASEKDVDVAIQMLQTQFELFLRNSLQLTEEEIDEVVGYGWGTAGRRKETVTESGRFVSFYYRPHMFPGMDLTLWFDGGLVLRVFSEEGIALPRTASGKIQWRALQEREFKPA